MRGSGVFFTVMLLFFCFDIYDEYDDDEEELERVDEEVVDDNNVFYYLPTIVPVCFATSLMHTHGNVYAVYTCTHVIYCLAQRILIRVYMRSTYFQNTVKKE